MSIKNKRKISRSIDEVYEVSDKSVGANNQKGTKSISGRPTYQRGEKTRGSVEGRQFRKSTIDRNFQEESLSGEESETRDSLTVIDYVPSHSYSYIVLVAIFFILIMAIIWNFYSRSIPINSLEHCIQSIKEKYPKQDDMFWKAIITGINGTVVYQDPSTYIFLHKAEAKQTLNKLVNDLSKCTLCQLSDCNFEAIYLEKELQEHPELNHYGALLAHLKSKLEHIGLLIVNLDTMPEKVALALHNICDEIAPLVGKVAVFFTLKVDDFERSPLSDSKYTQYLLKKKWKLLNEDEFYPLWTRISSMLLRVFQKS